jgi:class 3 adenylate cyclase
MSTTPGDGRPWLPGRIPFRIAIVTVVVGLLVVTCSPLIVYDLRWGQRSIELLKAEYLEQVADTAVREVDHLQRIAVHALLAQRYRFETGSYSTGDGLALARTLSAVLHADPDLQGISFSESATGRLVGASRVKTDEFVLTIADPRVNGRVLREFRADTLAPFSRTPPLTKPYDPRTRDWYRRALADPETIVWIPPHAFAEGVVGPTAALAVRDPAGHVRGVVAVDFASAGIASFLRSIKIGQHSVVALFSEDGGLLAGAPGPGHDALTRAVGGWTRAAGSAAAEEGARRAEVLVDGEKWNVTARSVVRGAGPEWIVAAAVPDTDFMGPIYANRRVAITITLVGLVLAVAVGIGLSTAIAGSLGSATGALDRIARFELEHPLPARSVLREVAQLEAAVERVTASLRSFSRYAPEEIVRDVAATGREVILSGEKREVTVLFTDLRGFTGFAERMQAEKVVAILNDHFDLLVGIIARHGGFVVDFLGDAVFAVFGAPGTSLDHAERAVACAIEMQRARAARNGENRVRGWPPMEMGAGISTGPAVVGNMGSPDRIKYGVVGHIVNEAARIETLTVGGQIVVADTTRQALGDRLIVDGPFEAEAKGMEAAMRLWEVLALRGEAMLVLPAPVRDLAELPTPIEARLRLIFGKQIERRSYAARLYRLGAGGAELESAAPLGVFSALQVLLPASPGGQRSEMVDGRVTTFGERAGARTALVRFTGVDWDTRSWIEARTSSVS